jgi:hypothetical protein
VRTTEDKPSPRIGKGRRADRKRNQAPTEREALAAPGASYLSLAKPSRFLIECESYISINIELILFK